MSRADWSFLEQLLEEGQENSTLIGRVWLTVLFLFRILALGTAAESAWDDEQSSFVCNTLQPGCKEVCYDQAFPISHFRYFVLQIIFVSTPTIFYFCYVAVRARKAAERSERERQQEERRRSRRRSHGGGGGGVLAKLEVIQEKDEEALVVLERKEAQRDGGGGGPKRGGALERPKLKGRLLGAYAVSIALKLGLEVGFILGLWFLYGFVVPACYVCQREPCPHKVDCYVSRPTEKTFFTIYIQAIAAVSVLLNILELLNLLQRAITQRLEKRYRDNAAWPARGTRQIARAPSRLETPSSEGTPAPAYEERAQQYLPALEGDFAQTDPGWALDVGVSEAEAAGAGAGSSADMLPSYLNCISGIRPLATNHISKHQQQQLHHMHKHSRRSKHSHHKGGDSKHRHYV